MMIFDNAIYAIYDYLFVYLVQYLNRFSVYVYFMLYLHASASKGVSRKISRGSNGK